MWIRHLLALVCLLLTSVASHAATVVLNGSLATDDDVSLLSFQLPAAGTVTIRTLSYVSGGFDPVLSLFDGASPNALLAWNEDGPGGCGLTFCLDAELSLILPAGPYLLAITESANYPFGPFLSDGFLMAGTGNFTGGPFLDIFGEQRTGNWTVEFQLPDAPVPEPTTLVLTGLALGAVALRFRKRI